MIRRLLLWVHNKIYDQVKHRLLFKLSAQRAHEHSLHLLIITDRIMPVILVLKLIHRLAFTPKPITIGGVSLTFPLILAAGFVKGQGFADEATALQAVTNNVNIIPGWRTMPTMVGAVEFGSFTRHPRMGNSGVVMWRDVPTESTQNRIGLKNPGVIAAATFLQRKKKNLPKVFGINIAPSPGISDLQQEISDICESMSAFIDREVIPSWFTLNLSCPNTEDDPGGHQTESRTDAVCRAVLQHLAQSTYSIPLWVKISPALSQIQYEALMRVFNEHQVAAVIATNTHGETTPDDPHTIAGVGGWRLHPLATTAVAHLRLAQVKYKYNVDIIACGGILDGEAYRNFQTLGVSVMQYWSALVYRGPLAAATIESEVPKYEAEFFAIQYENGREIIIDD